MFRKNVFSDVKNISADQYRQLRTTPSIRKHTLLDVRSRSEYEKNLIPDALLIPIHELDQRLGEISPGPVVVYCAVGYRSRVAAQFLKMNGFEKVYNLRGGIEAWDGGAAAGPPDMGFSLARDDATPADITLLAYGLEEAMCQLMAELGKTVEHAETRKLLVQLSESEDIHKDWLFGLFLQLALVPVDRETFVSKAFQAAREDDRSVESFIETHRDRLETVEGMLDVSSSLEAQLYYLYSSFAQNLRDREVRDTVMRIAGDEKRHLVALGELMEKL